MNTALVKHAKLVREKRIKILRLCACAWPIREYRTPSGHAKDCPATKEWERQYDAT